MNRYCYAKRIHKLRKYKLIALALLSIGLVALTGCKGSREETLSVGDSAPKFTLPAAIGHQVSLSDYLGKANVLLYFHMAYG